MEHGTLNSESAGNELEQKGLLGMEAIFSLVEHNRRWAVNHFGSLLFSAHSWQTVHEFATARCLCHQR